MLCATATDMCATASPVVEETLDVSFVCGGEVDVLCVPATFRGSDLRKQLAKQLSPDSKIKLFVLKCPDGSWPSQDDVMEASGVEMRYVLHLRAILGELGDQDIVHFRVDVTKNVNEYNNICDKSRKRMFIVDANDFSTRYDLAISTVSIVSVRLFSTKENVEHASDTS